MTEYNNRPSAQREEQEIDLVALLERFWWNRWFIVRVAAVFALVGLLVAMLSPKEYEAWCDVVPQVTGGQSSLQLSPLAQLAGVEVPQGQDTGPLSPYVYENILKSVSFRKELMHRELYFPQANAQMSLYDYFYSEEWNPPTVWDLLVRYSVGLPRLVVSAIRDEESIAYDETLVADGLRLEVVSEREHRVMALLDEALSLNLDSKNGYVTISATMPEAVVAAQLAGAAVALLQRYITQFKIAKVQSNLDFVQQRYDEVRRHFEDVQSRRARYRDANQHTIKNAARVELERIEAEYTLAMNLCGELAMQLEQAKIKVKETTPILTIISPVTIPVKPSRPRRAMIFAAFTLLGVFVAMGCVWLLPVVAQVVGSPSIASVIKHSAKRELLPEMS